MSLSEKLDDIHCGLDTIADKLVESNSLNLAKQIYSVNYDVAYLKGNLEGMELCLNNIQNITRQIKESGNADDYISSLCDEIEVNCSFLKR